MTTKKAAPETIEGFRRCTEQEFFRGIGPQDVHPYIDRHDDRSEWKTRSGQVVGLSFPGWRNPRDESAYFLKS